MLQAKPEIKGGKIYLTPSLLAFFYSTYYVDDDMVMGQQIIENFHELFQYSYYEIC